MNGIIFLTISFCITFFWFVFFSAFYETYISRGDYCTILNKQHMRNSYIFTSSKQLGLKFYDLDKRGSQPWFASFTVQCKAIKHLSTASDSGDSLRTRFVYSRHHCQLEALYSHFVWKVQVLPGSWREGEV